MHRFLGGFYQGKGFPGGVLYLDQVPRGRGGYPDALEGPEVGGKGPV